MQSEVEIRIPAGHTEERKYIIDVLFSVFLGIPYRLVVDGQVADYHIRFEGGELVIRDKFWANEQGEPLAYLTESAFPKISFLCDCPFFPEKDIPVLYGEDEFIISEGKIICGIDIFASSFFMLTRWEEYVNKTRDSHGRFPGEASVAFRNRFLHRPVVNEYVEMLWNILKASGYTGERKEQKFQLVLTHDVDVMKSVNPLRVIAGDILKRRDFKRALLHIPALFKDPVDTYSFLMDQSEKIGVKSHFYFMAVENRNNDYDTPYYLNTKKFRRLVRKIRERGHVIGFHPGYTTCRNEERWGMEKNRLEHVMDEKLAEGRQHYLMMEVPYTLRIWEKQGMKVDSTLGYADREGFRCGTGNCFPVFDFLERRVLGLYESPLVVMDGTLRTYRNQSCDQAMDIISSYIACGKKYNMPVTFLFHNSSFDRRMWQGWKKMYKKLLA
ncbi:MAG: polysaccharide deacetylase family protein [Odoribacter splanchnicus]